jgi:hypothetical protein
MNKDLQEAIESADTTERDAKYVYSLLCRICGLFRLDCHII